MTAGPAKRATVAAVLIAFAAVQPAAAIGGGGFSVSGKAGPFVKQVAGRKIDQRGGAGAGMGLAADAMNQGQFQAARLAMPQTEAKVQAMLDAIEANWPYAKDLPTKVIIVGQDYYNAYSLPDGSVVVGFGLLDQAQSDDEVAFVLAHELGHIRLGHFAQQAGQQNRRKGVSRLGQAFAVGSAIYDGARGGSVSATLDAGGDSASRRAGAAGDLLHFVNNVMVAPSMSRAQEDEADALGFDLTQMRPYSAESASARVFDTVQKDEDNRRAMSEALEGQMKKELTRAVGSGAMQSVFGGGLSGDGMKMGLLKGAGRVALGVAGSSQGGPKHRTPEERKKGVADYSIAAYPAGLPLREEERRWLDDLRATKEYADAKITVQAVRAAMKHRADGQYGPADAELAKAAKTGFRSAAMVLNESARLRDDMGDAAEADRQFMMAHQSPDQSIDGYLDHVRMLFRTRQNDRAFTVIEDGTRRFNNDDKPFLSLLIAISRQNQQAQQADQYLKRCLSYGDEGLTKDCQLAAGDGAASKPKSSPGLPRGLPLGGIGRFGF